MTHEPAGGAAGPDGSASAKDRSSHRLNSGYAMPRIGFGTWPQRGPVATQTVINAVEAGYRLLDTAASYGNEDAVGLGVRQSGVPREDLFITTKVRGRDQGSPEVVRRGVEGSLERLGLDYVDLILIHWPMPKLGLYVDTYLELLNLAEEGLARSVGVSNFKEPHLQAVVEASGVEPAVNQFQVSPSHARAELVANVQRTSTVVQAYSPLERNTGILEHQTVRTLSDRHGKTPAQVLLRWLIDRDISAVPHSGNPERQRLNADIFDFQLTEDEVATLTALDTGKPVAQDSDDWEEL